MRALYYIIDTLIGLYQIVVLLRLLMQLTRADFRNPIARGIVQVTDPLVLPLRRLLPSVRRIDTASVVAVLLVSVIKIVVLQLLLIHALPGVQVLARATLFDIIDVVLRTYLYSMILNAILSFVAQGNYSPVQSILASICNPVLKPIRKYIPSPAGLDLSPLWACIAIQALRYLIG